MVNSFGFRYAEPIGKRVLIHSIGYEKVTRADYILDGRQRNGEGMLFQYTLSGCGYIDQEGQTFAVPEGHAFLVTLPGDHRYYYSPSSKEPWEFIWVRFGGDVAALYWDDVLARGTVHRFDAQAEAVQLLWSLYRDVASQKLSAPLEQTVRLYEWLMHVWHTAQGAVIPSSVQKEVFPRAVRLMREQMHRPIALQEMADAEQLSRSYFCKQFHLKCGVTPIVYLNRMRIEEAARLLSHTALPVADIAHVTGFDDVGYFTKLFKRMVGKTPTGYRQGDGEYPVTTLKIL